MHELHDRGYIILPSLLSADEVDALRFAADAMEIPPDVVRDAANEHGIVPLMGPPGTVVVFDCLIIHGSAPNVSPWPRRIFYMNFVPAAACDLEARRPRFECDPIPVPLTALAENCLVAP